MFTDDNFIKYKISTKDSSVGTVEVNMDFIRQNKLYFPFVRDKNIKKIKKYGTRDNQAIENFIINCLNDYYTKLVNVNNFTEKQKMLDRYMHLYSMWRDLYNYKNANDLININNTYDMFLYELYTMNYTN